MENKTCGECQWYDHHHLLCVIGGEVKQTERAKDCFVSAKPTNGDRVRQGGNKRLITFSTEWSCFHCAYHNGIERKCERPEGKDCFDGIEAWLNAPAESEVSDE